MWLGPDLVGEKWGWCTGPGHSVRICVSDSVTEVTLSVLEGQTLIGLWGAHCTVLPNEDREQLH